jgi:hypothetical protein
MRRTYLVTFAALAACGTAAQALSPPSRTQTAREAELMYQGLGDPHDGPSAYRRHKASDAVQCLKRKSDGQRVCHTAYGWRQVARELEGKPAS